MKSFYPLLALTFLLNLAACNEIPTVEQSAEVFQIKSFSLTPNDVAFTPSDGVRDTTISVQLSVDVDQSSTFASYPNALLIYELRNRSDGEVALEGTVSLSNSTSSRIETNFDLDVRTFDFREYSVSTFIGTEDALLSNTAQSSLTVTGFPVGLPEIEFVENPDTVVIPAQGQQRLFQLKAKVSHPFDQSLINRVMVGIRDQNNNFLPGSPFRMYDDGSSFEIPEGGLSGDVVPGDSVYTRQFQLGSTNNPDVYTLFYHAIDNFGFSSDTVQSQMRFIR